MGNSTTTLQSVVDFVSTMGDLAPALPVSGFTSSQALAIANAVMQDMLAVERFPWKWNRIVVPPFTTNSWQQDYAQINITNLSWLESCIALDINNTVIPKPIYWPETKRDLQRTSIQGGRPMKICWLPNNQLVQGSWPGAGVTYTQPIGATTPPANPMTNIADANGNILVLTTYGVTGMTAPVQPVNTTPGTTVNDGTCVWTVANPYGAGFRIAPLPAQTTLVYQMFVLAQATAAKFTALSGYLSPIPDDAVKFFQDGFIAYAHRQATDPKVRAKFPQMLGMWLKSMGDATRQADRESDDAGFVPDRNIMVDNPAPPVGPAWPFQLG